MGISIAKSKIIAGDSCFFSS